jgi:hypothetical protein
MQKIKTFAQYLIKKPKILFALDSFGALMTASFLFILFKIFPSIFGFQKVFIVYLSYYALGLCIYSTACFLLVKNRFRFFLRGIAGMNTLYCFLTSILLVNHYQEIRFLGFLYFGCEIFLLFILVYLELYLARLVQ